MAPPQIRDGMNARIPVKFMLTLSLAPCGDIGKKFFCQNVTGIFHSLTSKKQISCEQLLLSLSQFNDPVQPSLRFIRQLMRYQHDRFIAFQNHILDFLARPSIQIGGRLVHEQDFLFPRQRPCDSDTLSLPAGKVFAVLQKLLTCIRMQSHRFQKLFRLFCSQFAALYTYIFYPAYWLLYSSA